MRKLAGTLLLFAALAPAAAAQSVPTRATLDDCRTGEAPAERLAVFGAQMGTLPKAKRLQVRFDLQERTDGKTWRRVAAPGLGVWRSSTADIFRYRKQVTNLQAPADYRAIVRFRWLTVTGKPLRQLSRRTAICRQPDPGADLAVQGMRLERAGDDRVRYVVTVANDGRAAASSFDVLLTIGPTRQPAQTVEGLGAGEQATVIFVGPRCQPGSTLTVAVDPDGRVDERDRADNTRDSVCPSTIR